MSDKSFRANIKNKRVLVQQNGRKRKGGLLDPQGDTVELCLEWLTMWKVWSGRDKHWSLHSSE